MKLLLFSTLLTCTYGLRIQAPNLSPQKLTIKGIQPRQNIQDINQASTWIVEEAEPIHPKKAKENNVLSIKELRQKVEQNRGSGQEEDIRVSVHPWGSHGTRDGEDDDDSDQSSMSNDGILPGDVFRKIIANEEQENLAEDGEKSEVPSPIPGDLESRNSGEMPPARSSSSFCCLDHDSFVHGYCQICEEELTSVRDQTIFWPCGHRVFHAKCYDRAIRYDGFESITGEHCPICDKRIVRIRRVDQLSQSRFMELRQHLPHWMVNGVGSMENCRILDGKVISNIPLPEVHRIDIRIGLIRGMSAAHTIRFYLPPHFEWRYGDIRIMLKARGCPPSDFDRLFAGGDLVFDNQIIDPEVLSGNIPMVADHSCILYSKNTKRKEAKVVYYRNAAGTPMWRNHKKKKKSQYVWLNGRTLEPPPPTPRPVSRPTAHFNVRRSLISGGKKFTLGATSRMVKGDMVWLVVFLSQICLSLCMMGGGTRKPRNWAVVGGGKSIAPPQRVVGPAENPAEKEPKLSLSFSLPDQPHYIEPSAPRDKTPTLGDGISRRADARACSTAFLNARNALAAACLRRMVGSGSSP